jgi:hypothetical protein
MTVSFQPVSELSGGLIRVGLLASARPSYTEATRWLDMGTSNHGDSKALRRMQQKLTT